MAGIQSARLGRETILAEETVWLGGMVTSAGVSAIDGNYNLPSGLWEEFRQNIYHHYGGPDSVKTGWVSNVMFEPNVAANILAKMATDEPNLGVKLQSRLINIQKFAEGWQAEFTGSDGNFTIEAGIVIDATELGDVSKVVGIPYDIGMDSRNETGEDIAPEKANNIIQDMTYVVVLEEFEAGIDKTIPKPENYDPSLFYCTCAGRCSQDTISRTLWDCDQMMRYGKLPGNKYMINWPIYGNDYYLNAIEQDTDERERMYQEAKWFTKCYVYYLQTELGYRNFGIAENVFPTPDGFPMIPYHRESRRIKGMVQFTLNDLAKPFEQPSAKYRTGIAVGDYAVDHHHAAYPDYKNLPDLHFYPIPSYSIPLGALIPKNTENFIVAEKSISVTNLVNGTTRLQPVCMLIGQAAGTLAALASENNVTPSDVSIRSVQDMLLQSGAFIMPYADVDKSDRAFLPIQKIGATGILKGQGVNIGWENKTLFYPDSIVSTQPFLEALSEIYPEISIRNGQERVTVNLLRNLAISQLNLTKEKVNSEIDKLVADYQLYISDENEPLDRREVSVLLDHLINPFVIPVDHSGQVISDN